MLIHLTVSFGMCSIELLSWTVSRLLRCVSETWVDSLGIYGNIQSDCRRQLRLGTTGDGCTVLLQHPFGRHEIWCIDPQSRQGDKQNIMIIAESAETARKPLTAPCRWRHEALPDTEDSSYGSPCPQRHAVLWMLEYIRCGRLVVWTPIFRKFSLILG